ncbi:GABR2-like protein, partial [Mya arenaria]
CDPGVGMDALYDLIYRHPQLIMVIGGACSEVTKTLAEIVPYWNLLMVSFASTSPALSEREKYRTFFRLAPADSSQNAPRAMFISHFGWDTVATLYEMEGDNSLAMDEMGNALEQHNITIKVSTSFRRLEDIHANLIDIKKQDARIIIGGYSERAARHVLCQAYKLGLYQPRYVWILLGDYVERWWEAAGDTSCTNHELRSAAQGYFTIDSLNSLSDDEKSSANISLRQFLGDYDKEGGPRPLSPYATSTYDAVWTVALTLQAAWKEQNRTVLEKFTYQGGLKTRQLFFNIMQNMGFLGISGPVSFKGPDRKGISVISQNQYGTMTRIALFEPNEGKLNFDPATCRPILWTGGRAPRDKTVLVARRKKIHSAAFVCVSSISVCGLVLASGFLAFNLYHRKLRYIKLSSPKLNNMAVVGCMLVYAGIVVLGYDDSDMAPIPFSVLCTTRAFLFSSGFSLAFGAMFTKTYRVHQIFTRANRGLIKSKLLRDQQLLCIVGALLLLDSLVLLVWAVTDPMQKHVTDLNTEAAENDEDLLYISQLTTCRSNHLDKWTGALYAYKGLLLIFGLYMAWETRHVKIPALNDSRYIGMNVYNVVIMSVLVVTLSNILSHQPTLAYVMESSFMLISTTTTLCLLFVPKIYALMTSKGEPVIAASGITVDANCRRFAVDEKRELYYRAEVQNRLEQEIIRLERLLELPVAPYPRITSELLYLLPESRVDATPTHGRILQEKELCNSISDAGDICMGVSEERSEVYNVNDKPEEDKTPAKPFRLRANRLSIRVAKNYAYNKLCKLRPRFSVGHVNFKYDYHEYEDLKSATISPDGFLSLGRARSSHPLLRQEAVDERRALGFMSELKQSSEKSETKTLDTHISDDDDDDNTYSSVTFTVPRVTDTWLAPSTSDFKGCDDDNTVPAAHTAVSFRRRRKYGNTLEVPSTFDECQITEVDDPAENRSPRFRRARSILEHERRTRIKKLQSDLRKIQKELQDLDELEYTVSVV